MRSLCEMLRRLPTSLEELEECHGMGPKKVRTHGEFLVAALAPHVEQLRAAHAKAFGEAEAEDGKAGKAAAEAAATAQGEEESGRGKVSLARVGGKAATNGKAKVEVEASPEEDEEDEESLATRRLRKAGTASVPLSKASRPSPAKVRGASSSSDVEPPSKILAAGSTKAAAGARPMANSTKRQSPRTGGLGKRSTRSSVGLGAV